MQRNGGRIMDWEVMAIMLSGGAAVFGIGYLLSQYRYFCGFDPALILRPAFD
jgi:hypothetical protein